MRYLLLFLAALLQLAARAQIETPGSGTGGGGGTSTPYYGPFTNVYLYGTSVSATGRVGINITNATAMLHIVPYATNTTGILVKALTNQTADLFRTENSSGTKTFTIRKDGAVEVGDSVIWYVNDYASIRWGQSAQNFAGAIGISPINNPGAAGVRLELESTSVLQFGADAATATAQTIKAHDGSGTDKNGADLSINGGQGTGAGVGGALLTKTALTGGGGGSGLNSYSSRHYAYAGEKSLTDNTLGGLFNITVPSGKYCGIDVLVTIKANDGMGGWTVWTIKKNFSAYNDAGTINYAGSTEQYSTVHSLVGTETVTISGADQGSGVFRVNATFVADSWSETPSNIRAKWQIFINSDDLATVTPL
jgi:hypothetical protein